uniref:Uncharacterized protein n=1 Tax=Anguilla anguilla TaxID=7936 RepID=A0A0E9TV51_ANGAN
MSTAKTFYIIYTLRICECFQRL